jgi:cytosine/adenosine deaminase-related metal-dependent hydrolase
MAAMRPMELLRMVTTAPAAIFGLPDAGILAPGGRADLLVVPAASGDPAAALLTAARRDVALVAIGGRPMVAAPALLPLFRARRVATRPACVDGVEKLLDARLARAISRCPIAEPGVEAS